MGERTSSGTWTNANGAFSRNPPNGARLGFTDEPPTAVQRGQMEQGTDPAGDEGDLRVIPVAVGAVATVVNIPTGCDVSAVASTNRSSDGRIRFTRAQLDRIWASETDADQWDEVLPGATGPGCDNPIIRVPRFDSSGTTFVYKEYLQVANPGRGWLALGNTTWPNNDTPSPGKQLDADGPDEPGTDTVPTLQRGATNGNGALATKVAGTEGSIGYLELSTARSNGFSYPDAAGDDRYWMEAQNGNADQWTSPDRFGAASTSDRGANCHTVAFRNVPGAPGDQSATLADWNTVSGINTDQAGAYPICSLTYGLTFDDMSDAYGNTDAEEAKARTAKDYLAAIERFGQAGLTSVDQSPLPTDIRSRARAGIEAIDWCKDGCGQSGGTTTTGGDQGGTTQTPATTPQVVPPVLQPIVTISNLFTIRSVRTRGTDLVVTLRLPGAGRAQVTAVTTARRRVNRRNRARRFTYARAGVTVAQAGDVAVRLPRSSRATSELRRAVGRRGSVLVTVRFTPNGGQAREQNFTRRITVRATTPRRG
jgi:ABC-type phosphate transport system substrate-binding protein